MGNILHFVALICFLAPIVCHIIILIHAFQNSPVQGLLCLCIPCYAWYYAIVEFQHEKKGLILTFYFAGTIIGSAVEAIAQSFSGGLGG